VVLISHRPVGYIGRLRLYCIFACAGGEANVGPRAYFGNADDRGCHFFSILEICHESVLVTHGARPVIRELGLDKRGGGNDMNRSIERRKANEQQTEDKYPTGTEHSAQEAGGREVSLFSQGQAKKRSDSRPVSNPIP
jgi:hypothetical protein